MNYDDFFLMNFITNFEKNDVFNINTDNIKMEIQ